MKIFDEDVAEQLEWADKWFENNFEYPSESEQKTMREYYNKN